MTRLLRLTLVALCIVSCFNTAQSQTRYSMFVALSKPVDVAITHPASFVAQNGMAWGNAVVWIADNERIEFPLVMPEGDTIMLDVERFRVVDEQTPLYELALGTMTQVPMPASLLLRGKVQGSPSSHVMLALFESWATGYITLERSGVMQRYLLSPLTKTPRGVHIINKDIYAVHPTPWSCGTVDTDFPVGGKEKGLEQTQAVNKIVRVAVEGDEEYYIDHGRNVYKCAEYAQAVIAASSDIYQRDVSAAIMTPWMGFWTATDPYPGIKSDDILTQLRTYWLANRAGVDRAAVTLLSGVNGIGGVAYLDALCTNLGYAVSGLFNTFTYPVAGYAWDTDVVSHEIGHNVGARHTHSCTWNPPIDSCVAAEGTCYTGTKPKLGTIMSYCHLTPSGTQLAFHARVSAYMVTRLAARACVLAPGTMTVRAGNDSTICIGASVVLTGSVTGGTGPYTYAWTPLIAITNANTLTPTVSPTKNITYVLEVRDNAGKINSDTVKIVVGPLLTVSVPSTLSACTESQVSITATPANGVGAYQYTWMYDGITVRTDQPTLTFRPLFADTIEVIVLLSDSRGLCQAVDTAIVYVNRSPYVYITGPTVACRGEVVLLNTSISLGRPPYVTQWMVNNVPKTLGDDNVYVLVEDSLDLWLIVTDANGCMDTTTHSISMLDYKAQITPSVVQLPPIPPCADTASVRVVLTNTGTLPLTITQSNVLVLARPLPRTIAPAASDTFDVHLVNLPTGTFTDTLKFVEAVCARVYTAVLKGQRNGVRVASPLPLVVGPFIACLDSSTVDYTFTIANDAGVSVNLVLPEGSVPIPARSDTTIRRSIRDVFADSIVSDTLRVPYTSGSCSGLLSVPLVFRSRYVGLDKPENIAFGGVLTDATVPISKSFQLRATTGAVPFVSIDSVDVSAPFSTTLTKGQRLNTGVIFTSSVAFNVSQTPNINDVRDTLRIRFSGCSDVFEIPLSAVVIFTDLDAEIERIALSIGYYDGVVAIHIAEGSEFAAEILDLHGRSLVRTTGQGSATIDTREFASGVYAVRVTAGERMTTNLIMITQ